MGEHDKPPFHAIATDQTESEQETCPSLRKGTVPVLVTEAGENAAARERPECNWEGYRPEILSVWFDP
jgi:hypothetical protein